MTGISNEKKMGFQDLRNLNPQYVYNKETELGTIESVFLPDKFIERCVVDKLHELGVIDDEDYLDFCLHN